METDDEAGGERVGSFAGLAWRRSLGLRKERWEVRAAESAVRAAEQEMAALRLRTAAAIDTAGGAMEAARTRLGLAEGAVREATAALDAEAERFRLGEGRSRNVLDAQKDVTRAVRRRDAAAADLLTAWADIRYACGYGGEGRGSLRAAENSSPAGTAMDLNDERTGTN
jgi:outer membrane protein TolC